MVKRRILFPLDSLCGAGCCYSDTMCNSFIEVGSAKFTLVTSASKVNDFYVAELSRITDC